MTLEDALQEATRLLAAAGVEQADRDADLLLRHVTGFDLATVLSRPSAELAPEARSRLFTLVTERGQRRPLQHLTGTQAFWRHEFRVTPDVLIPRPETELLVEIGLEALRDRVEPTVVDVGTGSGCIALSLAAERPDAVIHAVDISAAALSVARENARRLGLLAHVTFHLGDLLASMRSLTGKVALVVSNPPYVDAAEASSLAPEVRDHEPALALFAPGDRYSVYRRLAPAAAEALNSGGFLLVEVGLGMAEEVSRLCETSGLRVTRVQKDLQGIPRAILARRTEAPTTG